VWQQRIRATLAPLRITHVQFVLLANVAWLERSDQPVSQVALSRHARADTMMTSQVVRALEVRGLVTRAVHPADTRAKVVVLTVEGREVVERAMPLVEAADERFFAALGGNVPAFARWMRRVIVANAQ
jgi:DNA-binding MarR family transcriptional regulator